MESVISFPFRFDGGGVAAVGDRHSIWKDRVFIAITTMFKERVMRPGYGTDLLGVLFEDEVTAVDLSKRTISTAFSVWLTELTLNSVSGSFSPGTTTLVITVNYTLPNAQQDTLTFKTATFSRSGDLLQEIM